MAKTDKPEDLNKGRLIDTVGTCKYCKNNVFIKAAPLSPQYELDEIATQACDCKDGKDARELETSVRVLTNKIGERYKYMPDAARDALIACLKPVAYGQLDKVSVKVDDATTIKIYRSTKGLNLKRTVKEDDIMDEWSPS